MIDTQYFLYFAEEFDVENYLNLNEDEFTEYQWLTPSQAIQLHKEEKLAVFFPQMEILLYFVFIGLNYKQLKELTIGKIRLIFIEIWKLNL